jgi:hypothetical protein
MTVNQFIARAMRLLGLVQAGEAPTADEYENGLEALNLFVAGLRIRGVDMGWQPYTADQGGETMPYPDEDLGHLSAIFAVHLSSEYGKGNTVPASVAAASSMGFNALWSKYNTAAESSFDRAITLPLRSGGVDRTLFS